MNKTRKKGLFGLFKNIKPSAEASKDTEASDDSPENEAADADMTDEATAISTTNQETDPPPDNKSTQKHPAIWETADDPLLMQIDEEPLHIECNNFMAKMHSVSAANNRTAASNEEVEPIAAQPHLYISQNLMAAWLYITPPINDGQDIKLEDLKTILEQEHVTTGTLEDALKSIVEDPIYNQAVLVAKGIRPRNGIDGSIKDHFKRVLQLELKEDEKGSVDYKDLNNIQSVKEGETICEITLGTPGENGLTVTGKPYPCEIKGTNAPVPAGRNTLITEDKTLLISQTTGHISFNNGKFQVDPVLKINGDIDNSTGNLDYNGNIMISGDVRNGFSIKATGSINIKGSVEGAEITAKGSITIASGMSGNGHGVLTSDSDIKCRYLEHCTVSAGGSIYAESIINSKVESNQDIMATSGVGVIIGGSLLASNSIHARIIGSKARRLITELTIAKVPKTVEETNQLTKELKQHQHNLSEVEKNITYLKTAQRNGKEELLEKLNNAFDFLNTRVQEITERLNEINIDSEEQTGIIQCQQLLPIVRIHFGSSNILVKEEYSSSIIYKNNDGEIIIGNS